MADTREADPLDVDFLLDRYNRELDRKDRVTAAVSFPTTMLVLLGSVLTAMARWFSFETKPITVGFVIFISGAVAVIVRCLLHLSDAYRGQTYTYLPPLVELEEIRNDLGVGGFGEQVASVFGRLFRVCIMDATDANALANHKRQAHLDRANVTLLVAAVITAAAGGLYVTDQILRR